MEICDLQAARYQAIEQKIHTVSKGVVKVYITELWYCPVQCVKYNFIIYINIFYLHIKYSFIHIWDKYIAWTEHIGCIIVLKDILRL